MPVRLHEAVGVPDAVQAVEDLGDDRAEGAVGEAREYGVAPGQYRRRAA
jgi:hypothetical protein